MVLNPGRWRGVKGNGQRRGGAFHSKVWGKDIFAGMESRNRRSLVLKGGGEYKNRGINKKSLLVERLGVGSGGVSQGDQGTKCQKKLRTSQCLQNEGMVIGRRGKKEVLRTISFYGEEARHTYRGAERRA